MIWRSAVADRHAAKSRCQIRFGSGSGSPSKETTTTATVLPSVRGCGMASPRPPGQPSAARSSEASTIQQAGGGGELSEHLPVPLQQAVARGDVEVDQLLERATRPGGGQLCPWCGINEIDPDTPAGRRGICIPCAMRRLADGYREKLAEIEAIREVNALKTALKRVRDELE